MKLQLLTICALLLALTACGPTAPEEAEVKKRYTGSFCAEHYLLEIREDGSYMNRRTMQSLVSGMPILEKCKGTWKVTYDKSAGQWKMEFAKSTENSSDLVSCSGTSVLWDATTGWVLKDSSEVITEMFDSTQVSKKECEL